MPTCRNSPRILLRGRFSSPSGAWALWTPEEHLIAVLIQDSQRIRLLRHVQRFEQGLGSHLCLIQISCVVLNRCQHGMSFVGVADPEELNDKHHTTSILPDGPTSASGGVALRAWSWASSDGRFRLEGLYRDADGATVEDAERKGLRDGLSNWEPVDAQGRPLTPMARPGRFALRTSIGIPTGW